ncbi:MAG: flagellar basal body rod protein FlgC [Opitutaceae bacterium]|nr:flagellar basal body rod protein FlgC [Opitutaceae bacterium]
MNLLSGIEITASALGAQKTRLDIIAQNIANAQTTRTAAGGPYQRKLVSFETELLRQAGLGAPPLQGVRVAAITSDPTPGEQVYDPQNPDANAQGIVALPNVNLAYEMVDLITATRTYEANLSVAKNAREMAQRTLRIGQ